jgi:aromatic-L-amino-acid decarboxylase
MPPEPSEQSGLIDFADLGPELSRDWRGLRVWLPIKVLGLKPFRENLSEKLRLATLVTDELSATPGLEILAKPQLSILAFAAATDELTERLLVRINSRGRVFLSGCVLRGRKAIRICLLSGRAHEHEALLAVKEIRAALSEVLKESP